MVVDQSFRVRWLNVSGWGRSGGNLTTDYTDGTDGRKPEPKHPAPNTQPQTEPRTLNCRCPQNTRNDAEWGSFSGKCRRGLRGFRQLPRIFLNTEREKLCHRSHIDAGGQSALQSATCNLQLSTFNSRWARRGATLNFGLWTLDFEPDLGPQNRRNDAEWGISPGRSNGESANYANDRELFS